ncbi:U3 small nucleolar RNA-associated protein 18 homolog isoform X2 [Littorina saxatilis]|uniref:U3 small nucleolar RNA-associated protein 18 homolog n=1 Tax=Littorina saxatilis TaxID=31220 RepID=A0AAN9B2D3_9CAEN
MLRRGIKRSADQSDGSDKARTSRTVPSAVRKSHLKGQPLGAKRERDQEEKELRRKVFGGEEELKEVLTSSTSTKEKKQKKKSTAALNAEFRKPAWEDPDDNPGMFEKLAGTPKWAKLPTSKDEDVSDDDSDVDELTRRTGTNLVTSSSLPSGLLQIKRCPDANSDSPSTGKLTCVKFHPTAQVLMTGSTDQTIRLFQIDGKNNPKIQNVFLNNFPVMSADFLKNGEEVVMGSKHQSFYYYDMIGGNVVFVPKIKGLGENNMASLRVTPDGKFIVFLGSFGNIHLVSAKTKEWIHTLHMSGTVADITFTPDGSTMFATGDDGKVFVFDLNTRQCVHHFFDDGCVHGTTIALSHDSQYLVCGSNTGVVNTYDKDTCMTSQSPRPLKAIMNLTTSCTTAVFNPCTEILALASNVTEKAVKLVHFPSFSVFSNFPELNDTKMRIPCSMDFSRNSGFLAMGNHKGRALLYRLNHYGSY